MPVSQRKNKVMNGCQTISRKMKHHSRSFEYENKNKNEPSDNSYKIKLDLQKTNQAYIRKRSKTAPRPPCGYILNPRGRCHGTFNSKMKRSQTRSKKWGGHKIPEGSASGTSSRIWSTFKRDKESAIPLETPGTYFALSQTLSCKHLKTKLRKTANTGKDLDDRQFIAKTTPMLSECSRIFRLQKWEPQSSKEIKIGNISNKMVLPVKPFSLQEVGHKPADQWPCQNAP